MGPEPGSADEAAHGQEGPENEAGGGGAEEEGRLTGESEHPAGVSHRTFRDRAYSPEKGGVE